QAVDLAQRALRRAPDDAAAHRLLGLAWMRLFDRGRAVLHLNRCLEIAPGDAEAAVALATLEERPVSLPADFVRCLFDEFSERYDDHMRRRLRYKGPEHVLDALRRTGGLEPGLYDVLDLGCGTGLSGEAIRPFARRLEGIDVSAGMVAKARERGIYDALAVADMLAALGAAARWDLILAVDALVYVGDLGPVLAAVAQALRPHGRFAGTVEESAGPDLELKPTRRFGHARGHVERTVAAAGLRLACLESASYREEKLVPVPSLIFVAVKEA
ncbi:MAG: methyltransferase domain-containing protein, partial [Magnetospirillum sp. WYHS-4]